MLSNKSVLLLRRQRLSPAVALRDPSGLVGGDSNSLQQRCQSTQAVADEVTSTSSSPRRRPIYVAATRQHVGKTSVSLALISGLQRRFDHVGFMKPVGQKTLDVSDSEGRVYTVDKDAALIKQHFGLDHISFSDASPVLIPPGYTRDYIKGKITSSQQRLRVEEAYERVSAVSDVVLCEGTGHCAVGSIVNASNAEVASWLQARMVLVVNGGLGAAYDELELNRVLCEKFGVDIAGVVVNKVKPDKYEQTREYLGEAIARHGVPLLGCIPDRPFLGCPALADFERLFPGAVLVSGKDQRLRHYRVDDLKLVATSLNVFLKNLRKHPMRTLYVCHASRNDILLGFLMEAQQQQRKGQPWESALLVTGCEDYPISTQVLEIVTSMPRAPPVLMMPQLTHDVMNQVYRYTPKLNLDDGHRVETAVEHYEPYIDFDLLLERVAENKSSTA